MFRSFPWARLDAGARRPLHSLFLIVGTADWPQEPFRAAESRNHSKGGVDVIRLRTLVLAGAAGIVLAFFLDPESGERRRDSVGKRLTDVMRRGRRQVDSTARTLRKAAS